MELEEASARRRQFPNAVEFWRLEALQDVCQFDFDFDSVLYRIECN